MLSDDKQVYGAYKERRGWNAAIDAVLALTEQQEKE